MESRAGWNATRDTALALGLAGLVFAVFARATGFSFAGIDDTGYVSGNRHVLDGLSGDAVRWAFTTRAQSNWHPLTWLSLQLDATIGGADPRMFHATSVLLHAANTLLLFAVLRAATSASWRSACVAAVFAVHPLHVESVAWIAERKDVLSTLFLILTAGAWMRYVRSPSPGRYAAAAALFAAGLLAKPMLVSVPFLLLLLERWPLGRSLDRRAILDKLPLLALSAGSSAATLWAQSAGGSVGSIETFPLATRLANAVVSAVDYLGLTVWPAGLAVLYPYDFERLTPPRVALSLAVLAAATAWAAASWKRRPWIAVGWFWYAIALVPVLGIVQVGVQARADRYTYVPMIGLLLAAVWGVGEWVERRPPARRAAAVSGGLVVSLLAVAAWVQVGHWRDAETVFTRALAVTRGNAPAHVGLGLVLYGRGDRDGARSHYEAALRISPRYVEAHVNLAAVLVDETRFEEAAAHYREALLHADDAEIRANLAVVLSRLERYPDAEAEFQGALRLDPGNVQALQGYAVLLSRTGRAAESETMLRRALEAGAPEGPARASLGTLLLKVGRLDQAEAEFLAALRADPGNASAHKNLGVLLMRRGRVAEAIPHFEQALRADPSDEGARRNLDRARGFPADPD